MKKRSFLFLNIEYDNGNELILDQKGSDQEYRLHKREPGGYWERVRFRKPELGRHWTIDYGTHVTWGELYGAPMTLPRRGVTRADLETIYPTTTVTNVDYETRTVTLDNPHLRGVTFDEALIDDRHIQQQAANRELEAYARRAMREEEMERREAQRQADRARTQAERTRERRPWDRFRDMFRD